jgi:hypothetical protein
MDLGSRRYENAQREISSLPDFMGRSMLLPDDKPWLRRRTLRAFVNLSSLGARGLADLGWHLLTA